MGYYEDCAKKRKEVLRAYRKANCKLICDIYDRIMNGKAVKLETKAEYEYERKFIIFSLGDNMRDSLEKDLQCKFLSNKIYKFDDNCIDFITRKALKDEIADTLRDGFTEVSEIKRDYDTLRYHLV